MNIIFRNGLIRTLVPRNPTARDIAVKNGFVADPEDVEGPTEVVDLGGRCVVPGFTDSHVHFPTWALAQQRILLDGCQSLSDALGRVAEGLDGSNHNGWLTGFGWRDSDWSRPPSRHDLDPVTNGRPTALWSKDYHTLWVNSTALSLADDDVGFASDLAERDRNGELTGVLRERAAWEFRDRYIASDLDEQTEAVLEGISIAHTRGVTAIHDKDGWLGAVRIWQRISESDRLTLRVWQSLPIERLGSLRELGLQSNLGDPFLRLGPLKLFVDGALGSATACMSDGSGILITSEAALEETIKEASAAGWPLAVHAVGDEANRVALDAFESTLSIWSPLGLRQRVEHAQHVSPSDIPRFAELGVACSVQFSHAPVDRDLADALPREIVEGTYAFRSLWDSGAIIANGSDAPVDELDPLQGIRAAVLRTRDKRPAWRPDQALTVEEALIATTANPAWLSGDEHRLGRLGKGFEADLVVLSRDPVTTPSDELEDVSVVATMVGGRWVFNAPPWD